MPPAALSSYRLQRTAHIFVMIAVAVLLPLSGNALADQATALSLQGFSGILNTPTGHVQSEGSINALFSNQKELYPDKKMPPWQNNYLFSVGMFRFAEIGGRLTTPNGTGGGSGSDISANAKISSAPFTAGLRFSPAVAIGQQDLGGGPGAHKFRTTYLAASADPLPWLRLSTGYGRGPDRMKGIFGGVELKAHDWVTLLGEYDTRDYNAGLRLSAPPLPWFPVSLTFTAKSALNRSSSLDIAFGLTMPLDTKKTAVSSQLSAVSKAEPTNLKTVEPPGTPIDAEKTRDQSNKSDTSSGLNQDLPQASDSSANIGVHRRLDDLSKTIQNSATSPLSLIRSRLVKAGFINVRVGQRDNRELVVEYENIIFNHNELDALGVVAGMAAESAPQSFETLRIIVKRRGISMISVAAPIASFSSFMKHEKGGEELWDALTVSYDTGVTDGVVFVAGDGGPGFPSVSLMLSPGLTTFVGTEVGVFDYLLSLKPELAVQVWKGGVVNARWDIPLTWSENLDDGKQFSSSRTISRMERLMLFQAFKPLPDLMLNLGGGMVLHDNYGTLNEATWSPGGGEHSVRLTQAWTENEKSHRRSETYLGSYRYFFSSLDLSLEATAGRFWAQDRGYLAEVKRFFGDAAVSLYYKNSTTYQEGKRWQAAGIQFAFPLTPRRDLKVGPLVVRGTDEWAYAQETTLAIGGQKSNNVLTTPLAINPQPPTALYRAYYNRGRLSSAYIKSHLERLREAWLKYGPYPIDRSGFLIRTDLPLAATGPRDACLSGQLL